MKTRNFWLGLSMGLALGLSAGASVVSMASEPPKPVPVAKVVGENGYLSGWEVTKEGEEVCSDPYIYVSSREIECD